MPGSTSNPSLEPLLRVRNSATYTSGQDRDRRRHVSSKSGQPVAVKDEFLDFVSHLGRIATAPITIPLNLIQRALTSPLTISLVLKLALLGLLVLGSAVFSIFAVGAFWWSWGTGGIVESEGWLTYGSKVYRTPHALVPLSTSKLQEDLRYDVEVEMELVRPNRVTGDINNFMLSLELRSQKSPEIILIAAAQPSLPPPPLLTSLIPSNPIPCLIPYPFRFMCPTRLLTRLSPSRRSSRRRNKGITSDSAGSSFRASDIVLLNKKLMEGVILVPAAGGNEVIGSAFVSIGREDTFTDSTESCNSKGEVRTTGWVVVRFIPRPTGIRWLLSAHPLPPLLLLPPISLTLTLSSSLFAFMIISYVSRSPKSKKVKGDGREKTTEEKLLDERRGFAARDREDKLEEERLRAEWEEVQERSGGLRSIPEGKKRSKVGESTIGGSETTISQPSTMPSFTAYPESSDGTSAASTQSDGETTERARRASNSDGSDEWVQAR